MCQLFKEDIVLLVIAISFLFKLLLLGLVKTNQVIEKILTDDGNNPVIFWINLRFSL